ncbi:uncharacterized protein LOC34620120 [Cyclospora cayetanensis]|uniref:Uncharacterized protein LOC34620120 n=1 Tax=Cyclospora cayetanensis TaxID=88456 RepID=A0A6P6S1Z2_9EIME|nr:uncharacterized protein LOC34620120 [Cyclospora cayetanensis]
MKGIPALHWTTVHSAFGNRDRSEKTSFSATSRSIAATFHLPGRLKISGISPGLFDPTLKIDQLEADERRRDVQQRRKLSEPEQHAFELHTGSSTVFGSLRECRNTSIAAGLKHGNRPLSRSQQPWKRQASLTELLLSGPTFRETIGHNRKSSEHSSMLKKTTTQYIFKKEVADKPVQLQGFAVAEKSRVVAQRTVQERGEAQSLQPVKFEKLQSQRQTMLGDLHENATGKRCASGNIGELLQEEPTKDSPRESASPALPAVSTTPSLRLANYSAPNATNSLTRHTQTTETGWLNLLSCTIQRVDEIQRKLVELAFQIPESPPVELRRSDDPKTQLWLECVLIELAEVLRTGPAQGTAKGTASLLVFLQEQQGQLLSATRIWQLLQEVRHFLEQAAQHKFAQCYVHCQVEAQECRRDAKASKDFCSKALWRRHRQRHCSQHEAKLRSESCCFNDKRSNGCQFHCQRVASAEHRRFGYIDIPPKTVKKHVTKECSKIIGHIHADKSLNAQPEEPPKHSRTRILDSLCICAPVPQATKSTLENRWLSLPTTSSPGTGLSNKVPITLLKASTWTSQNDTIGLFEEKRFPSPCCIECLGRAEPQIRVNEAIPSHMLECIFRVQEAESRAEATLKNVGESKRMSFDHEQRDRDAYDQNTHQRKLSFFPVYAYGTASKEIHKRGLNGSKTGTEMESAIRGTSRGHLQPTLEVAIEERILAFRNSRKQVLLIEEPLLQQDCLQEALLRFEQEGKKCRYIGDEVGGVWTLHAAIAGQVISDEVEQLVLFMDTVSSTFVGQLLHAEALRMAKRTELIPFSEPDITCGPS